MAEKARKTVGARELKTRLGTYIHQVSEGLTIVVTERGRPVAELRPLEQEGSAMEGRLAELVALGKVTGRSGQRMPAFKPVVIKGPPLSETIRAQREDRF